MVPVSPPFLNDDIPWDRLGRFLARELTAAEEAELKAWIATDPSRAQLIAELHDLWAVTEPGGPSRDPRQVLEAIRRREALSVRKLATHRRFTAVPVAPERRSLRRGLAAAAMIAGIALGGWWLMRTETPFGSRAVVATSTAVEHRTGRGQRLTLTLPDGSTVILAPESVLRYTKRFGVMERRVELTGVGYFDVVHDERRPFLVAAGNAVAHDIGTRFVVQARAEDSAVVVAVTEGRVALSRLGQTMAEAVLLEPSDLGRVDAAGHTLARRNGSLEEYLAWTDGRLVFEATPLSAVVAELNRWYDVDIRLEGAGLAERQLTASFGNEPISKVLPLVRASMGLRLRGQGRSYVLSAD